MKFPIITTIILTLFLRPGSPVRLETRDSSEIDPVTQTSAPLKWPQRTIQLAFSTSLNNPGPNIKVGSDVAGAARRALSRWSSMANLNFVVSWSNLTSVSPASGGDGVSLITVADTLENESFNADSTTARTRVFFDPETGAIAEADISINPRPRTEEGADLQFSTDGTPGTYDLEATFTHEIGHLLGLDHSAVLASTMQSRQGFNGTYGLPAFTERTLSEDDRQRVRSLYGPKSHLAKIEGRLIDNLTPTTLGPRQTFNVWAESIATGRVIASSITAEDGSYSLEGLTADQYRVLAAPRDESDSKNLRSVEVSSKLNVKSDSVTPLNYNLLPQNAPTTLSPRWIGLSGELSSVPLPVEAGKRVKIYVGGAGIDQVPGTSISVASPYFTVDPSSLTREQLSTPFPVISFDVTVAPSAPFGDYTLRLQSNSGETAYVPGAITIDPGALYAVVNPIDDARFFVTQQYSDLLGQPPDRDAIEKFSAQFGQCGIRADCLRSRRLDISTSLFLQNALQPDALFIDGLYLAGLSRRPRLTEFETDRATMSGSNPAQEETRSKFVISFTRRSEFEQKFGVNTSGVQFVDGIVSSVKQSSGADLASERTNLIKLFDGTPRGRAAILIRVVANQTFADAAYNQAFVQAQYFSYLKRDPDENGFASWLTVLKNKPLRDTEAARLVTCSFLNSTEYQLRFGLSAPHNGTECGN
ncbi:MAG: hypothetical protein C5B55_02785 [Blastocatellia bacterium]|nr:MAG: hypothetical protein C5B55_02785 [Blastocatellia bacterium]